MPPQAVRALAFGNVYPTDPYAVYGGRYVSLRAGLPETTPALTANMACGTGLYAVLAAARELEHGVSIAVASGADVNHVGRTGGRCD